MQKEETDLRERTKELALRTGQMFRFAEINRSGALDALVSAPFLSDTP